MSESEADHREALARASEKRQHIALRQAAQMEDLLKVNAQLTEQIKRLTEEIHQRIFPGSEGHPGFDLLKWPLCGSGSELKGPRTLGWHRPSWDSCDEIDSCGSLPMPYPRWLAKINKRVFNPSQIRKGVYPVVKHIGRTSGKVYETPLDAYPTNTGYVLVARYGPESDWVRNILAAGTATLRVGHEDNPLDSPRLVSQGEALEALASTEPPDDFTKAEDFLLMERQSQSAIGTT